MTSATSAAGNAAAAAASAAITAGRLRDGRMSRPANDHIVNHAPVVTMVATPVLLVLSGGLLLPVLAANVGLDAVDRIDASNMVTRCGGRGESAGEIAGSVATGAVLGADIGLAPK